MNIKEIEEFSNIPKNDIKNKSIDVIYQDPAINKTKFMKSQLEILNLMLLDINDESIKKEVNKIYELIRYSDYVSCDEVNDIENKIKYNINQLNIILKNNNINQIKEQVNKTINLIKLRNSMLKLFK